MSILLTGRIRLARNLADYPFEGKLTIAGRKEICEKVKNTVLNSKAPVFSDMYFTDMEALDDISAVSMAEHHLISYDFIKNRQGKGLLINKKQNISIMINEEDHLRIQVIGDGKDLDKLLQTALDIDEKIEKELAYCFDERHGFLTHCPTNLGTGLRASVMLHLPSLTKAGYMERINSIVAAMGLTIRGMYGEGSDFSGNIYQLSNQITMGITEKETVKRLSDVTETIEKEERKIRDRLFNEHKLKIEDDIFRSLGILKYSRTMSTNEFLGHISNVRLGLEAKLIKDIDFNKIDMLIPSCQPATLIKRFGKELTPEERDVKRAEIIREALA